MKFKAFTISELVVAMAISAIVATIGFVAFNSIGKTVELKSKGLTEIEQLQELRFLLKKDFSQFHDWEIINENKFHSVSGVIEYEFLEGRILRVQSGQHMEYKYSKVSLQKSQEATRFQIQLMNGNKQIVLGFELHNNILLKEEIAEGEMF